MKWGCQADKGARGNGHGIVRNGDALREPVAINKPLYCYRGSLWL